MQFHIKTRWSGEKSESFILICEDTLIETLERNTITTIHVAQKNVDSKGSVLQMYLFFLKAI